MSHVLVTNDFPPKLGGIQTYLWELWRRLPPDRFAVLTTPYAGDAAFDAAQAFRVERTRQRVLFPTRAIATRVNALGSSRSARSSNNGWTVSSGERYASEIFGT